MALGGRGKKGKEDCSNTSLTTGGRKSGFEGSSQEGKRGRREEGAKE